MTETRTLSAPGATIAYDLRHAEADGPTLLLIGSPMAASGFAQLAEQFADRRIVTYDPRGSERSTLDDGVGETTPQDHADDLHRVVEAVGGPPVDVFASSGGAVNALAWVAAYPGDVRTLVAHEPPLADLLPDAEHLHAAVADIGETYQRSGFGAGMAKFIVLVSVDGTIDASYADRPAPDPATFGLPTEDDGSRRDALLGLNLGSCTTYQPDLVALRAASTRIVPAVGADSGETMAARGGRAVAAALGIEAVVFPGDHGGFFDNEWGGGDPPTFAARLREALG